MKCVEVPVTHSAPEAPASSRLRDIVRAGLLARDPLASTLTRPRAEAHTFWSAGHFGFDRCRLFREATEAQQREILGAAARARLEEAYFIEASGVCFTAKMVLLAPTAQERMLYGIFASDETVHLNHVLSFLPSVPTTNGAGFLGLLSEIIQTGSRESLIFLVQVVLEGWGITHYHLLADTCQDEDLKTSLRMILKDEARHHGSGLLLNRETRFDTASEKYVRETLRLFFGMVRSGPQELVTALERGLGHLSRAQKIEVFTELGAEALTRQKLDVLKTLLEHGRADSRLELLESAGMLRPMTAQECAEQSGWS